MSNLAYWLYRWNNGKKPNDLWYLYPLVCEDSAFLAKRSAARVFQQHFGPPEPVSPERVVVQRLEVPYVWCAHHEDSGGHRAAWCALKFPMATTNFLVARWDAESVVGDQARTVCGWWIHDIERVALRLPTCTKCLDTLIPEDVMTYVARPGLVYSKRKVKRHVSTGTRRGR